MRYTIIFACAEVKNFAKLESWKKTGLYVSQGQHDLQKSIRGSAATASPISPMLSACCCCQYRRGHRP